MRAGVLSTMVIRPSPVSLFPFHAYEAPTPLFGPSNVRAIPGSYFSYGDHDCHAWKSFTRANAASEGASTRTDRSTWNVDGRVAITVASPAVTPRTPSPTFFQ